MLDYLREQDPRFNQVADENLTDFLRSLPLATVQYLLGQAFAWGWGVKQDWSAAVHWWRKAADQGHAEAQYNLGKAFQEGKGVRQDWSAAVHWWRKAADQGLADAQHQLGVAFHLGRGVKPDSSAAVHWWRKAADQGLAEAQYQLGQAFEQGDGVEPDSSAAVHWWRKAADQGHAEAQYQLGQAFKSGKGVEQDSSAAVTWWRKAADQGHAEAQYQLGLKCVFGNGLKQDWSAAVTWWRKAADQGHAEAQSLLSAANQTGGGPEQDHAAVLELLRRYLDSGNVLAHFYLATASALRVEQDYRKVVEQYRPAAEQGDAAAQLVLGLAYELGKGVEHNSAKAIEWYRKAADQGNALAQCQLANCYFWGWGVAPNPAEAIRWLTASAQQHYRGAVSVMGLLTVIATLDSVGAVHVPTNCYPQLVEFWRKQAEQGDPQGIRWLADLYEGGKVAAKDVAKAKRLDRLLAEQGDSSAQRTLGVAYEAGEGVPKNLVESYMWYNLAAAQGEQFAANWRDSVALQMTPDQIAEAQRRSTAFVPRKVTPQQIRDALAGSDTPRRAAASGTGFFVTDDGYLLTSYHVVADALRITVSTGDQELPATLLKADTANDVALLKVDGTFRPLAITPSRTAKLGDPVFTIGFPNIDLQGLAPKLTKGEISSLTGAHDDPRHFQISVAVQPGNSGGPLVDRHGNVIGLVQARLSDLATLKSTGALPQNVNYALKSAVLSLLLESLPELSSRLKAPTTRDTPFAVIAQQAQEATVLVLAY